MLLKKLPAILAVATLSIWIIHESQHLAGGGKDRSHLSKPPPETPLSSDPQSASPQSTAPIAQTKETTISQGENLGSALRSLGIPGKYIHRLVEAIKTKWDVDRLAIGTNLKASWKDPSAELPSSVELQLDVRRTLIATHNETDDWSAEVQEAVVETELAAYAGVVTTTLWNSASVIGMDPLLIQQLAEVFAWQIDFNREVQEGDRWRLTVQRHLVGGKPIGFGDIVAAEYDSSGQIYTAVRFNDGDTKPEYFMPDGSSLRRMFLRSPLKFGRITSGFTTRRFHPVLKIVRPHRGIDYGAPTGTPIMAVGDGTITVASRRGDSGNMIELKHNAIYKTAYKHLSRFAPGIRPGSKIRMGDIIGYVGATGLATGPHLHFEFYESGKVLDPQGLRFPRAEPIAHSQKGRFLALASQATAELPPWSTALLSQRRQESDESNNVH